MPTSTRVLRLLNKYPLYLLRLDLTVNGSCLTTFIRYSAKDRNELPVVGCHFLETASALSKLLNWVTEFFLNATEAVENFLIIRGS